MMLVLGYVLLLAPATTVSSMSLDTQRLQDSTSDSVKDQEEVVHCYCNLPECVTTNYMCKSLRRGCFSDLRSNLDVDSAIHGCIDLLPSERGSECQNVPPDGAPSDQLDVRPISDLLRPAGSLLLCCREDMCNHVDSPETRIKYNETILATALMQGRARGSVSSSDSVSTQELWFRAATVAVPVFGAVILLVLVLLAMKILRSDALDHAAMDKLRCKDGNHMGEGGTRCMLNGLADPEKKQPLLFQYNPCNPSNIGVHPIVLLTDKNTRNAKMNTALSPTGLFDKHLDLSSCNIYHNTTVPLIPPGSREKLVYKKAFVSWPNNQ